MKPVLRKIVVHGGMTALFLAVLGLMYAQLATMWISAMIPTRGKEPPPDTSAMKVRLPLIMAGTGFAFVTVGELFMHLVRRRLPPPGSRVPQPDPAEKLLEELLAQAEARPAPPAGGDAVAATAPGPENEPEPAAGAAGPTGRVEPEHAATR